MPKLVARDDTALLADYGVLLDRVQATFALGQQRTEEIKLQAYWDAGRLIHEHLRHHRDKSGYGQQVVGKLALSLGVGQALLYRMLQFYEAYPIFASWRKLGWSHLRTLSRIADKQQRLELETRALREHWNAEQLEKQVQGLTTGANRRDHDRPVRLVDGDTLWLRIWLTASLWLKEKVRLRGIDCPELDTPEGKAAKRFVETQVKRSTAITITTTKPDKWDRNLCDILLRPAGGGEVFLNNLLLEQGRARRYDKVTPADWEG